MLVKDKSKTFVQKLSELMIAGTNKRKAIELSIRKVKNLSVASIEGYSVSISGFGKPPPGYVDNLSHARKHSNDMLKCQY